MKSSTVSNTSSAMSSEIKAADEIFLAMLTAENNHQHQHGAGAANKNNKETSPAAGGASSSSTGVAGPKHKNNALVGFDPLLTPSSVSTTVTTASTSEYNKGSSMDGPLPSMPILTNGAAAADNNKPHYPPGGEGDINAPPPPPPRSPTRTGIRNKNFLTPTGTSKSLFGKHKSKKRGHRKTQSLTGPLPGSGLTLRDVEEEAARHRKDSTSLSPLRNTELAAAPDAAAAAATTSGNGGGGSRPTTPRILQWPRRGSIKPNRHRKTQSELPGPPPLSPKPPSLAQNSSRSANNSPTTAAQAQGQQQQQALQPKPPPVMRSSTAPMIQELLSLDLSEAGTSENSNLILPSLAKPRPTSFLTGQEGVVRSSEQDPSSWQLEIPSRDYVLTCERLCQFMETYSLEECLLDLKQLVGISGLELSRFARGENGAASASVAACHRKIVESLLETGKDISEVKGFVTSANAATSPDARREVLILERQNKFVCVFRGTVAEQNFKFSKNPNTVQLHPADSTTTVYADRYSSFAEIQTPTFELLDKLCEDNPFCDVSFCGHGYGAALATLAAYTYANTRTNLRVSCVVSACPKVGPETSFRWAVHSTPNLNMWRLELGKPKQGHVGHSIRFSSTSGNKETVLQAYKFGVDDHHSEATMTGGSNLMRSLITKGKENKTIHEYVSVLEKLETWVKVFHNEDGAGVRGTDNEARQMA